MKTYRPSILQSQIRTTADIWKDIQHSTYPADRWLRSFFYQNRKKYGSRDRRFFSDTIFCLFRHKTLIETWMSAITPSRTVANKTTGEELAVVFAAAMEGIISAAEFESFAAPTIYPLIREKKLPKGFTFNSTAEELSTVYSFPLWLVQRWIKHFGLNETKVLLAITNERPQLAIRINPIRMTRERQMERFRNQKLKFRPTLWSNHGIILDERISLLEGEDFQKGFFEVQDEGSQLVCEIIAPKEGETVWDVCAGGGGKSLFMAGLMKNKGRIIATDIRPKKLEDLRKRATRSEIFNIFPADLNLIDETAVMKKGVDKIVIDAPCSGSGTLRRNPDAKWKLSEQRFLEHQKDQIAIIEKAIPYLKQAGELFYITCSIEPSENEEVIENILENYPNMKKSSIYVPDRLSSVMKNGFVQLWPPRHHTDGFFMAKLRKV